MIDFTMCGNADDCPLKNSCLRYMAEKSFWQSYSNFYQQGEKCRVFSPVREAEV